VYPAALIASGDHARAAQMLVSARHLMDASGSRAGLPELVLQSAKLAARQGGYDEALRDLEGGLAVTHEMGLADDQALLLEEYGQLDTARDPSARAPERLAQALAIFRELGAAPDVQRVEQAMLPPRAAGRV
jgi:hypothetical protein